MLLLLLLLLLNSIRCTTRSVSVSRPVRVLSCCWILSVVLLVPFWFPVPFVFLLYCWSYYYWKYYYWKYYYSCQPCLLWLIFITKQIIAMTRRIRSTVSIDLSLYGVVPDPLFLFICRSDLVFLCCRTPTNDNPISLFIVIVEFIFNLIRMHLFRRLTFLFHVSVIITTINR